MSVKKDENGKWFFYGAYPKGHPKYGKQYKKRGFKTKREASKAEVLFREKQENPEKYMTFPDLVKEFLESQSTKVKKSTMRFYESCSRNIIEYFGSIPISEITEEKIQGYIDNLDKKMAKTTVSNRLIFVKSIFLYAKKKNIISINLDNVEADKRKNEKRKKMKFWEPEDFKKFISCVDDKNYHLYFSILYYMGCRKGECAALTWKDINFEKKTMRINKTLSRKGEITTPKTENSNRIITMPDVIVEELKEWRKITSEFQIESDMIFPIVSHHNLRYNMKKYTRIANERGANIEEIRIHDLRHSHASYLINNMSAGFTDFDIAQRLGDTVSTLHSTYAHWFARADKNIVDFMNNQK